ncbi:hypothetical protein [Deinococcus xinjiangensis]
MTIIKVDRRELLRFMNSGAPEANGHHTAMIGFLGEPLAVGLILHYLEGKGKKPKLISLKVTQGTRKGSRLDAWISDEKDKLYQTEIKMWGGNAIGGLYIKEEAETNWLAAKSESQWHKWLWDSNKGTFRDDNVRKVLTPMRKPKEYDAWDVEPLLCLWWMVQPSAEDQAWFTLDLPENQHPPFKKVHVFSLTRYLMSLEENVLELELPLLGTRLEWLKKVFPA